VLSVGSNKTLIPNLNANLINGLTSTQLQRRVAGGCGADAAVGSIGRTGSVACHATGLVGYATPGAHSYVAPAGVTEVIVEMWGGGGGGGSSTGPCQANEASGGGQGAYLRVVAPVTPGQSYTAVVGTGGPGGDADCGQAPAGGDSTFASLDVAGGGGGGGSAGPATVPGGLGGSPAVGLGAGIDSRAGAAGADSNELGASAGGGTAGYVGSGGGSNSFTAQTGGPGGAGLVLIEPLL
jgi:hypothetical protein